ncbi:MAG: asparagine synthetase B [Dehalococcoidia bacterium]
MAGLVGIFTRDISENDYLKNLVNSMARDIHYAGWDIFNQWDSPRLSVARVHHGVINPENQPIFNEDHSICIFMDGEVFDYESSKQLLIREGHRFNNPNNDAEYCLHLYESKGTKAFAELNGSFVIILYHLDSDKIVLAGDRMLSRPFYYFCDNEHLVFGSQLRPILRFPGLPRRLDMQAVYEFFYFRYVLREKTYYQDIKSLPPAGLLQFSEGKLTVERYWKPEYKGEPRNDGYYVEALTEALKKAVWRRTRDRHRYGILLSGGFDSRTILNADVENKITVAFTQGDFENREVRIARKVAAGKGCKHVFLKRDVDHYYRNADKSIDIGDGMWEFWNSHNLGFLEAIHSEVDILFDGYAFGLALKDVLMPKKHAQWFGYRILLPDLDIQDVISGIFQLHYLDPGGNSIFKAPKGQILDGLIASVESWLKETPEVEALPVADRINHVFLCYSARQILDFLWILHTRQYLEPRLAIWDNDLLDLTYTIPARQKVNGKLVKEVLTNLSLLQSLIPSSNTGLPAFITFDRPEGTLQMAEDFLKRYIYKPRSFDIPYFLDGPWPNYGELFRYNAKLRNYIANTVQNPECLSPDIFDLGNIGNIYEKHMSRQGDFALTLTALTTFGRWYEKYGPSD